MKKIILQHLPSEFQLTKKLETDVGLIYLYGNIAVFEAKEGAVISYQSGFSVLLKGLDLLEGAPWSYISNRVNSYSIKPIDYKYLNNLSSLKAIAVVCYSDLVRSNAELESKFCKKPFRIFNNLSESAFWAKGFL